MSMYTIVMNSDKSLTRTVETTLYQGENLVDKLKFLLPKKYGEHDLSEFSVALTYIDGANILRSETLVLSDPNYKNSHLCYCVPVSSDLTRFAGDIKIHLTLSKGGTQLMHSGNTSIHISPTDPCFQKVPAAGGSGTGGSGGGGEDSSQDDEGFDAIEF